MRKIISILSIAAVSLGGFASFMATPVAQAVDNQICTPINLISSASTQTAGYTITNPTADPLNPTLYSGGGEKMGQINYQYDTAAYCSGN